MPTSTLFRTYPDGEVVALFPTIPADDRGHCLSYAHIGQHGAAHPGHVIRHTHPAGPEEYRDLMAELVRAGYTVRPIRRIPRYAERRASLEKLIERRRENDAHALTRLAA